jgi:hypothetical protein
MEGVRKLIRVTPLPLVIVKSPMVDQSRAVPHPKHLRPDDPDNQGLDRRRQRESARGRAQVGGADSQTARHRVQGNDDRAGRVVKKLDDVGITKFPTLTGIPRLLPVLVPELVNELATNRTLQQATANALGPSIRQAAAQAAKQSGGGSR